MTVVTVVGARPQFIKAAPVSAALADAGIDEILVHTGQHHDEQMSSVFFEELGLAAPAVNLGVGSLPHGAMTGRMLEGLEAVLTEHRPQWVLVYGDTNSTLAGALAAVKLHIPVAHVEAGLRSYNRAMPEEINRVVTDHVANLLLAPTSAAAETLAAEGVTAGVHVVGDVMYDAVLAWKRRRGARPTTLSAVPQSGYAVATVHRAENTDDPSRLNTVLEALRAAADQLPVVLPLHPRTRNLVRAGQLDNLVILPPVGYTEMQHLLHGAAVVLTDSGGLQKEAFFHQVPCVTVRTETEWNELVALGWNRLAPPTDIGTILSALRAALSGPVGKKGEPYGDGSAAPRIASLLA